MVRKLEKYYSNLGFNNLESVQFSDLLVYLEDNENSKNINDITAFLFYLRNKKSLIYEKDILNRDYSFVKTKNTKYKIVSKKQINSKWNKLSKCLKDYSIYLNDLRVIDMLKIIYNVVFNDKIEIDIKQIFKQVIKNKQFLYLDFYDYLKIINYFFDISNLEFSLTINYLFLKRYINNFICESKLQMLERKLNVNDLDIYSFFKERKHIDLLQILLLHNDGLTYEAIGEKNHISSTQARNFAYEGLQFMVDYIESDKGLYSIKGLFTHRFLDEYSLQRKYPRYYRLVMNALVSECFYNQYKIVYDKVYRSFYCSKYYISDQKIINQFAKIIDEVEYQELQKQIKEFFLKYGILIRNDTIVRRLKNVYRKLKGASIYQCGYVGEKNRGDFLLKHNYSLNAEEYQRIFGKSCNKRYLNNKNEI